MQLKSQYQSTKSKKEVIAPQVGPQQAFAASPADICVFGGQAGGGKSYALLLEAGKWTDVPGYGAIIFRREMPDIIGPGGLWEVGKKLYKKMGGRPVASPTHVVEWPDASIHFRHLEYEDTVLDHDGKQYALVCFDEGQYFTGFMIWYLWGRCRSTCGVRPYMRITCNPDPDCYLRKLLAWWIDEATGLPIPERDRAIRWCVRMDDDDLKWFDSEEEGIAYVEALRREDPKSSVFKHMRPISVQFIRSELSDNKALLEIDPDYGARVAAQDVVSRAQKLEGNWNAKAKAGELFDRTWFEVIDSLPQEQITYTVRGWDLAASIPSPQNPDPDWTVGVLMHRLKNGNTVVSDVDWFRLPPGERNDRIVKIAKQDGIGVTQCFWQDPAQAGVVDKETMKNSFYVGGCTSKIEFEIERKDKIHYAKPYSAQADPRSLEPGKVLLVKGPWNHRYLSELEHFPKPKGKDGEKVKIDSVDASSRAFMAIQKVRKTGRLLDALRAQR